MLIGTSYIIRWGYVDLGRDGGRGLCIVCLWFVQFSILVNGDPNQCHIQSLRGILLCFEAVSGLKVSLPKSEMVAVCNVRGRARLLGCKVLSLLMKYLDLHLGASFKIKTI